jgi:hypothetical protein
MYIWEDDHNDICSAISEKFVKFKIVLKTKDDSFFIKRWIEHHSARDIGIVVFDNFSTDQDVLRYYKELPDDVLVVKYRGSSEHGAPHNSLHNVETFSLLYKALQESCDHFCFLDTDEFLSITDGISFYPPRSFFDVDNSPFKPGVNFSLYLYNKLYSDLIFEFGSTSLLKNCLAWGKPIISAKELITGFINHNIQIRDVVNNFSGINFIIFHLINLNPFERVKSNLRKLIVRGVLPVNATVQDALILRLQLKTHSEINLIYSYIDEISRFSSMPKLISSIDGGSELTSSHLMLDSISKVSEATFVSVEEKHFFRQIITGAIEI